MISSCVLGLLFAVSLGSSTKFCVKQRPDCICSAECSGLDSPGFDPSENYCMTPNLPLCEDTGTYDSIGRKFSPCSPCEAVLKDHTLLIGNSGFNFSAIVLNSYVLEYGVTDGFSNSLFYSRLGFAQLTSNLTYFPLMKDGNPHFYAGKRIYVNLTSTEANLGVRLLNITFTLPCGCDFSDPSTFSIFPPIDYRHDDGRPKSPQAVQSNGKIYLFWIDASLCATQFSVIRVHLGDFKLDRSDPFDFSNNVQRMALNGSLLSYSLLSDQIAQSSNCGRVYGPLVVDDVSNLQVGEQVTYCIVASDPTTSPAYTSAYSCTRCVLPSWFLRDPWNSNVDSILSLEEKAPNLTFIELANSSPFLNCTAQPYGGIYWESSFRVDVMIGKISVFAPGRDTQLTWRVFDQDTGQEFFAIPYSDLEHQSTTTDFNGQAQVGFQTSVHCFPSLRPSTRLSFEIVPERIDVTENLTIVHQFECHDPKRPCTKSDPFEVASSLFAFGQISNQIQDTSSIALDGYIGIKGTESDTYPYGCPFINMTICAYAAPGTPGSLQFWCASTDSKGKFELFVPMFSVVAFTFSFNNVTRSAAQLGSSWPGYLKASSYDISNLIFQDITQETLFVKVAATPCQIPVASSIMVRLFTRTDSCLFLRDVKVTGPSDSSGIVFPMQVPAFSFQVQILSVLGLNGAADLFLSSYFSLPAFIGRTIELTNTDYDPKTHQKFADSNNQSWIDRRTMSFQYDPDPAISVSFVQKNQTISTPKRCQKNGYSATTSSYEYYQVIQSFDQNDLVTVNISAYEEVNGTVCNLVNGTVIVQNYLTINNNGITGNFSFNYDPQTNSSVAVVDGFIPTPDVTADPKLFSVYFVHAQTGFGSRYPVHFHVLVTGQLVAEGQYDVVFGTPTLLAVVYDPPGDLSYSFYENMETHVIFHSQKYSPYVGSMSQVTAQAGTVGKFAPCYGLFGMVCTKGAEGYDVVGLTSQIESKSKLETFSDGSRRLSRRYKWSMKTSGGLDKNSNPGPDSDLFLVTSPSWIVIPTYVITDNPEDTQQCRGNVQETKTMADSQALLNSRGEKSGDDSTQWVTRKTIRERIIPNWRLVTSANASLSAEIQKAWNAILNQIPIVASSSDEDDYLQFSFSDALEALKLDPSPVASIFGLLDIPGDVASLFQSDLLSHYDDYSYDYGVYNTPYFQREKKKKKKKKKQTKAYAKLVNNNLGRVIEGARKKSRTFDKLMTNFLEKNSKKLAQNAFPFISIVLILENYAKVLESHQTVLQTDRTLDKRFYNWAQSGVFSLEDKSEFYSQFFSLESIPKFRVLPKILSLWNPTTETIPPGPIQNITFSGGGSEIRFTIEDFDKSSTLLKSNDISTKSRTGGVLSSQGTLFVVQANAQTQDTLNVETRFIENLAEEQSKSTKAGFVLKDSNSGDYFSVGVFRETRYGTFAFELNAGSSKCPYEKNTVRRERPALMLERNPSELTPSPRLATFDLNLVNDADEAATYSLSLQLNKFDDDDFQVFVGGVQLTDQPLIFENLDGLTSYNKVVQVKKGSRKFNYNLEFILKSLCDDSTFDSITIPINFVAECPSVNLQNDLEVTLNMASNRQVQLRAFNPNPNLWTSVPGIQVGFQYVFDQAKGWDRAITVTTRLASLEDLQYRVAVFLWDVAELGEEAIVYLRAFVLCQPKIGVSPDVAPQLFSSVSPEIMQITVDKIPPFQLAVAPRLPLPGQDAIVVTFSESVYCGRPLKISATLTLDVVPPSLQGMAIQSENKNLIVSCSGAQLLIGVNTGKLPARLFLGAKAKLNLKNVLDLAQNPATSNVLDRPTPGSLEFVFRFQDLPDADYTLKGLNVTVSNPSMLATVVSSLLGLSQTAFRIDDSVNYPGFSVVTLTVFGFVYSLPQGRRLGSGQAMSLGDYLELRNKTGNLKFLPGGGYDVVIPESGCVSSNNNSGTILANNAQFNWSVARLTAIVIFILYASLIYV